MNSYLKTKDGWLCEQCKECFKTRKLLLIHRKDKHSLNGGKNYINFTCDFCKKEFINKPKEQKQWHMNHCYSNPDRIPFSYEGKHLTTEHKAKISSSVKRAHDEGRGHTWKNRWNNPSFAKKWLYSVLDSLNVAYKKEMPFYGFFLDVAIKEKGLCIEIDGEQHYDTIRFPEQIEIDKRKDDLLKKDGWIELRLRWSDVQKNPELGKEVIKSFIESNYSSQVVDLLRKLENERLEEEKQKNLLRENKQIDCNGHTKKTIISDTEWERRKKLILSSGVNLNEFGCLSKIQIKTGLTRRQVCEVMKKFNIPYKTHHYN